MSIIYSGAFASSGEKNHVVNAGLFLGGKIRKQVSFQKYSSKISNPLPPFSPRFVIVSLLFSRFLILWRTDKSLLALADK